MNILGSLEGFDAIGAELLAAARLQGFRQRAESHAFKPIDAIRTDGLVGAQKNRLGLGAPNCFRAYTLTGPDRLVIDIQTP